MLYFPFQKLDCLIQRIGRYFESLVAKIRYWYIDDEDFEVKTLKAEGHRSSGFLLSGLRAFS